MFELTPKELERIERNYANQVRAMQNDSDDVKYVKSYAEKRARQRQSKLAALNAQNTDLGSATRSDARKNAQKKQAEKKRLELEAESDRLLLRRYDIKELAQKYQNTGNDEDLEAHDKAVGQYNADIRAFLENQQKWQTQYKVANMEKKPQEITYKTRTTEDVQMEIDTANKGINAAKKEIEDLQTQAEPPKKNMDVIEWSRWRMERISELEKQIPELEKQIPELEAERDQRKRLAESPIGTIAKAAETSMENWIMAEQALQNTAEKYGEAIQMEDALKQKFLATGDQGVYNDYSAAAKVLARAKTEYEQAEKERDLAYSAYVMASGEFSNAANNYNTAMERLETMSGRPAEDIQAEMDEIDRKMNDAQSRLSETDPEDKEQYNAINEELGQLRDARTKLEKERVQVQNAQRRKNGRELATEAGTRGASEGTERDQLLVKAFKGNISAMEMAKLGAVADRDLIFNLGQLTETEKDVIQRFIDDGDYAGVGEYLDAKQRDLSARRVEKLTTSIKDYAKKNPVVGSLLNTVLAFANTTSYLASGVQLVENLVTGENEATDPNGYMFYPAQIRAAAQEGVTEWASGGGNVGVFLAQTAMSMSDSTAMMLTLGKISLPFMAANAAGDKAYEMAKKKITPGKTFFMATVVGGIEMATEYLPLQNIMSIVNGGKEAAKGFFKNAIKQCFEEATEELVAEYADTLAENIILGDQSEMNEFIDALMDQGLSQEEATRAAFKEFYLKRPALAALGGGISGFVMGGVGTLVGNAKGKYTERQVSNMLTPDITSKQIYDIVGNEQLTQVYEEVTGKKLTGDLAERAAQVEEYAKAQPETETSLKKKMAKWSETRQAAEWTTAEQKAEEYNKALRAWGLKGIVADPELTGNVANVDTRTGEIHISPEMDPEMALDYKIKHELGHVAARGDADLVREVLDVARERGVDVDAEIAKKRASYAEEIKGMTEEQATAYLEEEVFGDYLAQLSRDEDLTVWLAKEKPTLLQRILDAIKRLIQKLKKDGVPEMMLRDYQNLARKIRENVARETGATKLVGNEITAGDYKSGGIRWSYGGEKAAKADTAALERAKYLEKIGISAEQIRQETGWFRGMDGKWRFEIDDSQTMIRPNGDARLMAIPEYREYVELQEKAETAEQKERLKELNEKYAEMQDEMHMKVLAGEATLGDILVHDELFENYPKMRNMRVAFAYLVGTKGYFSKNYREIILDESLRKVPKNVLLHEIQHAIQQEEGFTPGASPAYWAMRGAEFPMANYANTAGEIEARDVDARRDMTAEERKKTAPDLGSEKTVFAGGDSESGWSLKEFDDGTRFVDLDVDQEMFDNLTEKEQKDLAIKIIRERFAGKVIGIENKAFVNNLKAGEYGYPVKMISGEVREAKMRLAPELDNFMDAGRNFKSVPDGEAGHIHPEAVDDFTRFVGIFKAGSKYFEGQGNVEITRKGRLFKDVTKIRDITDDIYSSYGKNPKSVFIRNASMTSITSERYTVNELKQKQFEVVQKNNPFNKELGDHTWIKSADDIKTYEEALADDGLTDEDVTPDFTAEDVRAAIKTGKVDVFSSHKIEPGIFVTPSKMEAQNYAGDGMVYTKTVNLTDVAWIDAVQGQYTGKLEENRTTKNKVLSDALEKTGIAVTEDTVRWSKDSTNEDYARAVERGDAETAGRMVREAAIAAGYDGKKVYHGTTTFDHTVFGDRQGTGGIFVTPSLSVAENYATADTGEREIRTIDPDSVVSYRDAKELARRAGDIGMNIREIDSRQISRAERTVSKDMKQLAAKTAELLNGGYIDAMAERLNINSRDATAIKAAVSELNELAAKADGMDNAKLREEMRRLSEAVDMSQMYEGQKFSGMTDYINSAKDSRRGTLPQSVQNAVKGFDLLNEGGGILELALETRRALDVTSGEYDFVDREGYAVKESDVVREIKLNDDADRRGVYGLYADYGDNPLEIEMKGRTHDAVICPEMGDGYHTAREVGAWAFDNGYTSVKLYNVQSGTRNGTAEITDYYMLPSSESLKSADPVTYDDAGNAIPLSERFDSGEKDIRWSKEDVPSPDEDMIAFATNQIRAEYEERVNVSAERMARALVKEFQIPKESRPELQGRIHEVAKDIEQDRISSAEIEDLLDELYTSGRVAFSGEAENYYSDAARDIRGRKIYVPQEIKAEFGDDWNNFRVRMLGRGVRLVNDVNAMGIDQANMELAGSYPGIFDAKTTDLAGVLKTMEDVFQQAKAAELTLGEWAMNEYGSVKAAEDYRMEKALTLANRISEYAQEVEYAKKKLKDAQKDHLLENIHKALEAFTKTVDPEYQGTMGQIAADQTQDQIGPPAKKGNTWSDSWNWMKRRFVDIGESVTRLGKETGDKNLYAYYNAARAATYAGSNMITEAQTNTMGRRVGPSLNTIWGSIRAKGDSYFKAFQDYLLHMHNIDRMSLADPQAVEQAQSELDLFRDQNRDTAMMTPAEVDQAAAIGDPAAKEYLRLQRELEKAMAKHNKPVFDGVIQAEDSQYKINRLLEQYPEFKNMAKDVYQYSRNLLQYRVDSGLIDQAFMDELLKMYPHYVPTYRAGSGSEQAGAGKSLKNITVGKTVGRASGGVSTIMDIDTAMARQTMQVVRESAKNQFGQRVLKAAENANGMNSQFIYDVQETKERLNEENFDSIEKQGLRKNIFTVYKDGKAFDITVDNGMFDAVKALQGGLLEDNKIIQTATAANNLFKSLVTGKNPVFMTRNFMRDLQDAGIYSRNLTEFAKNYPLAIKEIALNGKYWQQYKAMGGVASSVFDYQTGRVQEKSGLRKIAGMPFDTFEALNMAIEQAPRLAEFMSVVKNGDGSMESLKDAMLAAADVTVNFGRSGDIAKLLNQTVVPFLNPAIQGTSKFVRTFDLRQKKTAAQWLSLFGKAAVLGVAPTVLNSLLHRDDKEWETIDQYYKDSCYLIKMGDGKWFKVPKGRIVALFSLVGSRGEAIVKGEEVDVKQTAKMAADQVLPVGMNALWDPITRVKLFDSEAPGETWWGGKLESDAMQNLKPGERYDASTDLFSKWLGGVLNLSPKKINNLLDSYTGIVGDIVLPLMTPQAERDPFTKAYVLDSVTQNNISSRFYDISRELQYEANDGDLAAKVTQRYFNAQKKGANQFGTEIRNIQGAKNMSNAEKTEKVREAKAVMNGIQLKAIDRADDYREAAEAAIVEAKQMGLKDDDAVDYAYRIANRQIFGAEYALQVYNKDVYKEAALLNQRDGIRYDDYYDSYFGLKEIDSKGAEKKAEQAEFFAGMQLDDDTKKTLFLYQVVDKDSREKTREQIEDLMDLQMGFDDYMEIRAVHGEINEMEGTATEKATEFAAYLDSRDMTGMEKTTVKDVFKFYSMASAKANTYENLTAAGVSSESAQLIFEETRDMGDETSVWAKGKKVTDLEIPQSEKLAAMEMILSESAYEKMVTAMDGGVTLGQYVKFMYDTRDYDAKDGAGNTVSGLKKNRYVAYIDELNLPSGQKDALYLAAGYSSKDLKKTPWHTGADYSKYLVQAPVTEEPETMRPGAGPKKDVQGSIWDLMG